jgi:hypothetical protein
MAAAIGPLTVLWTASTDQTQEGLTMKTFVIEREIPGASRLTEEELHGITSTSNDAVRARIARSAWVDEHDGSACSPSGRHNGPGDRPC